MLWLIGADQSRLRLIDRSFAPSFYAHGPEAGLRRLAARLTAAAGRVRCELTEKTDLWSGQPLRVLRVTVRHPTEFAAWARYVRRTAPDLRLYNSDLILPSLYCWERGVFPLARVEVEAEPPTVPPREGARMAAGGPAGAGCAIPAWELRALACRDSAWNTDYELPPLRVMQVRLEGLSRVDPRHGRRGALEITLDATLSADHASTGVTRVLDEADEPAVIAFERLLRSYDPDLIVSEWGDSTIFPQLLRAARALRVPLSLNRDPAPVERSRAKSYVSYGRVLFKGSATKLLGRLHVDTCNSFMAGQGELDGLWELARVTGLPVQYAARTTTGTGISHMQMELAFRDGVLIPEQKAEPETPKQPDELLVADRGGLVFPPRLGFFTNVAELDFISEFPSIMARFNVSPETINCRCCAEAPRIPELGYRVCQRRRGLNSRVVESLIEKRQQYKRQMQSAPSPLQYGVYSHRRSALKWLLVCCFGYTGYRNARFGKIEAHEAINAVAREKLLVAMETAEARGFRVLHALVDSVYVQRATATPAAYAALAAEIERKTGLPLAIEAIYRYAVFLPSRQHAEIPVPNRFFCVSSGGELKIRGLECRRHDTPPLIARLQREALAIVAEAYDWPAYLRKLEEARELLERTVERLRSGAVPIEELVISRRLSRPPAEYRQNSHTALAARQLDRAGVQLRPGETLQYVITNARATFPDDRVRALTLWEGWHGYDVAEYESALRKAFEPLEHYARLAARLPPASVALTLAT